MSGVMAAVDQRTQLAGHNRLELLMFRLMGRQLYGINVFKVREVLQCPPLSQVPQSHSVVRGITNIRGKTITIMDLSMAIGGPANHDVENSFVVITEYNRHIQGFLVREVDRIVNLNWKDILPPPTGTSGTSSYMTAVTRVEEKMVEVIDVERVLAEVTGAKEEVSAEVMETHNPDAITRDLVLVSDDSIVARKQVCKTLEDLNLRTEVAKDGKQALEMLKQWADEDDPRLQQLALIISDIEMPEMDGYTFTTEVRTDPRLAAIYIILHTSMSGVFNQAMVDKVGANKFIAKFEPDILAGAVIEAIQLLQD